MLLKGRSYRIIASMVNLALVLGVVSPIVECCLADLNAGSSAHGRHETPMDSTSEMPADCHGGEEAPAPETDDCCVYTASSAALPGTQVVTAVTKPAIDDLFTPILLGDAPVPSRLTQAKSPPGKPEPAPRNHVYLLVSSLLI